MNISAHKLNCYIEGIRIPIQHFDVFYNQNKLSYGQVKIPIGNTIYPKSWANALVQITYIVDQKEKLLYQGLISSMSIVENESIIMLYLDSIFSVFNNNTTLDYVAPKRYGINKISSEIKIYIGNEAVVESDNSDYENFYLSNKYYFLPDEKKEKDLEESDPNAQRLEYIIGRTPFADKFAFSFFEQIAFDNFILTKAHVERLNLLNKTESQARIDQRDGNIEQLLNMTSVFASLDSSGVRTGFIYRKTPTTTIVDINTEISSNLGVMIPVTDGLNKLAKAIKDFEGWFKGSRSFRNNNPGNLIYGDFAKKYGSTGSDGTFAIFKTEADGYNALCALIKSYADRGHTLKTMMYKYAPPNENQTEEYIKTLAEKLGVSFNTKISIIISTSQ